MCQKSLKNAYFVKCFIIWITLSKAVSEKDATQYRLLKMLEKWNSVIDKGKILGALLTDSHKAFD